MTQPARLLGFAFANADLLFEIDRSGAIVFATGATREFAPPGKHDLVGRPGSFFFPPSEATKFASYARDLANGDRVGPIRLKLVSGKEASVFMFQLPFNGDNISCTLSKPGGRSAFTASGVDDKTGLASRESFLDAAARDAGDGDTLTLVEVAGLDKAGAKTPGLLGPLFERIGKAIRGSGFKTAGRLSNAGFAAITNGKDTTANFVGQIRTALKDSGAAETEVSETQISLKGNGLSSDQRMLALRYVVDRFSAGKKIDGQDLSGAFGAMMDETQDRMRDVSQTMAAGNFAMAYQPIKSLKTGVISHNEALVRFDQSMTAETVNFVEALGIGASLDLAVALKVLAAVEAEKDETVQVAINLSGHTISSPSSFGLVAGFLARKRSLAPRVLIEITETAAIVDLEAANGAVGALRAMGYRVGLDDFGAGAASLQYLHAFTVDFVKFDGTLVKKLGMSRRDDTLLRGMLKLCAELGMHTIAECIETAEQADMARDIGFDYGQGYYLGKPMEKIPSNSAASVVAKRRGVEERWG